MKKTENANQYSNFTESHDYYFSELVTVTSPNDQAQPIQTSSLDRGNRVHVFWPHGNTVNSGTIKHLQRDGQVTVLCDDGQNERLDMNSENRRYEEEGSTTFGINASSGQNKEFRSIMNEEPNELQRLFHESGNKPFLRFRAQGFEQYVLATAYKSEEDNLQKLLSLPINEVP